MILNLQSSQRISEFIKKPDHVMKHVRIYINSHALISLSMNKFYRIDLES